MNVRERLVSCGIELLERDGLQSISLREIAKSAGVSHGAPRHHFPTYASLLSAIARSGIDDLERALLPALADADARRGIHRAAEVYVDFAVHRPEMFELITRHDLLVGSDRSLEAVSKRRFVELSDALTRVAGAPVASEHSFAVWAAVHGVATLASRTTTQDLAATSTSKVLDLLLESLLPPAPDAAHIADTARSGAHRE